MCCFRRCWFLSTVDFLKVWVLGCCFFLSRCFLGYTFFLFFLFSSSSGNGPCRVKLSGKHRRKEKLMKKHRRKQKLTFFFLPTLFVVALTISDMSSSIFFITLPMSFVKSIGISVRVCSAVIFSGKSHGN